LCAYETCLVLHRTQAICDIAETCIQHGEGLAECAPESTFGRALLKTGEGLGQCRDFQYQLDDDVNQMFLSPIKDLLERDAKELQVSAIALVHTKQQIQLLGYPKKGFPPRMSVHRVCIRVVLPLHHDAYHSCKPHVSTQHT
jgi:hypothetical protein